ncbi:ABC transporter permease subunit [Ramlibacter sp. XY19]|uniref:ABC transporter permease subunit n=1 Tax=Ramlibacter paludis TaxID=2908000 RepID=UPI0023D9A109|nr:ABC transporter permease subunit [Ramlibacter paludis]
MSQPESSGGRWTGAALISPTMLFLAATVFIPVALLLTASLNGPSGFSYGSFERLVKVPVYAQVLGHTAYLAAAAASISVLAAFPVAVGISRASNGWRQLLWIGVLLPFWTSFLVRTIAWIVVLGRNGLVNGTLQQAGIIDQPLELLYTNMSVVVGLVHVLLPLAILTMVPVIEAMDRRLVPAAWTLGARPGTSFFVIYFPLCAAGCTAAWLTTFVSALGFFITPALLGSPKQTMVAQIIIQQVQEMMDWGLAAALALVTLLATLVVYWAYDRVVGLSSLAGEGSRAAEGQSLGAIRKIKTSVTWTLGRWTDAALRKLPQRDHTEERRVPLGALLILAAMTLPVLLLVPESFTTSSFIDWPPKGFSTRWYEDLFASPVWASALWRSLGVGIGAAVLASAIGIPAAFAFAHYRIPGRSLLLGAVLAPIILPRIIVALGLFYVLSKLGLVGSSVALAVGHAALALPFVVITVMATLKSYDRRLDAAASVLGARTGARLTRVTLPIIMPGIVSAFIFAFGTSFDDLTLSLFVSGGLFTTLPKQMWDDALLKVSPSLAAVSVLLFVGVLAVMALSFGARALLTKRRFA